MKLIQIVGRSNSGKTTFINTLIPVLKQKGQVAVIKHLGDHEYQLEKDKDTTLFFQPVQVSLLGSILINR